MTYGAFPNALPHLCVAVDDPLAAGHAKELFSMRMTYSL